MATNRLIQKLFRFDESGVGEDGITFSDRRQYEKFRVQAVGVSQTETIAVGDVVALVYTAGSDGAIAFNVKKCPADGAAIGVAISGGTSTTDADEILTSADYIDVLLSGIGEATVDGEDQGGAGATISAGDYLCVGDTAGVFYKYTAGSDAVPQAIACEGQSSGVSGLKTVFMLSQF